MNTISIFVFISAVLLVVALVIIENFSRLTIKKLIIDIVAIITGLIIGALLSVPLSKLPGVYGEVLPLIVSVIAVFATIMLIGNALPQIDKWLDTLLKIFKLQSLHLPVKSEHTSGEVVIDTSVLIDKRIVGIARTGFLAQKVVIPRFVLAELQNIADSKDGDRRDKGRRGLLTLEELKKIKKGEFEIVSDDFPGDVPVDEKLVNLSKKRQASLLTTDYNLNKVATLEGVRVLNVNDLAGGLKPELLPGDFFEVKIVHIGKDKTQGVGYLADGTMIVVERGSTLLEKTIKVEISRTLQTSAGKMYFARIVHA